MNAIRRSTLGIALAAQLSKQLVRQVVVDNKPGAGGTVGATGAARSKPRSARR